MISLRILTILPFFILCSAVYAQVENKWWNTYQEGLKAESQGEMETAITYFQKALLLKNIPDSWKVRTYGLNFIDYLPEREIGVCYHHLKKWDEAITHLQLSLRGTFSDKARAYLDLSVAEKKREEEMAISAPAVAILTPADWSIISEDTTIVTGWAEAEAGIQALMLNDMPLKIGNEKRAEFSEATSLKDGANILRVEAKDKLGRVTKTEIVVEHPPQVEPYPKLNRLSVAVIEFQEQKKASILGQKAAEFMAAALVRIHRFKIIDQRTIKKAMLGKPVVDPANSELAAFLAKELEADLIITGYIKPQNGEVLIDCRVLEGKGGSLTISSSIKTPKDKLQPALEKIAQELRSRFPLLEGYIVSIEQEQVFLHFDTLHGLAPGMACIVFRLRAPLKDPLSGKTIEQPFEEIGFLEIDTLYPKLVLAKPVSIDLLKKIRKGDRVIIK